MKFHRVLLFTSIQMDVTPVGGDLHVLLTTDNIPYIGCTAYASPRENSDPPACDISLLSRADDPSALFCPYVAEQLAQKTGKNVLCTGGIFVEDPDEHMTRKLYENVDELIREWTDFLTD